MCNCIQCGKELPPIWSTNICLKCSRENVKKIFEELPDVKEAFMKIIQEMKAELEEGGLNDSNANNTIRR